MIEILKVEDLEQYKNLIDECFGSSNDLDYYKNSYKNDANYTIIVYKENDIIVGSLTYYKIDLFTFSFQPCLEIFNVATLKSYRGKEIASKLFDYVFSYAKENNYNQIFLTCLDDAYDAHHLYEKVGFTKTSSLKYKLDLER